MQPFGRCARPEFSPDCPDGLGAVVGPTDRWTEAASALHAPTARGARPTGRRCRRSWTWRPAGVTAVRGPRHRSERMALTDVRNAPRESRQGVAITATPTIRCGLRRRVHRRGRWYSWSRPAPAVAVIRARLLHLVARYLRRAPNRRPGSLALPLGRRSDRPDGIWRIYVHGGELNRARGL